MRRWIPCLCVLILVTPVFSSVERLTSAEFQWVTLRELNLDTEPSDVSTSADGKLIFVLVPGEILIYSTAESRIDKRIPVDQGFDSITYSQANDTLILAGRKSKSLKVIQLQEVHDIAISGLPLKGPENAPVTIAVFGDYQ